MSDTNDTTGNGQVIEDDPIAVRRAKREALIAAGRDPYGHAFAYSHHLTDLRPPSTTGLEDGESTSDEVKVAGRVMAKRDQGKLAFLELRDSSGDIQLFCRINALGEDAFAELKDLDVGDWIGVARHHDAHAARPAVRGRELLRAVCPRACAPCRRSSTAWPTRRRAIASATWTSS